MGPSDEFPEPDPRESRVMQLLQEARGERAPASLRAEVEDLRRRGSERRAAWRGRPWTWPTGFLGAGASAAAAAVAAIAIVLVIALGGSGPSIVTVAALATHGPSSPAPAPSPAAPKRLLDVHVGDVWFPNWEWQGGWRASGESTDTLHGRSVTTVYYADASREVVYSIVSAPALGGMGIHRGPYAVLHQGSRTAVVWSERDHTCVLSSTDLSAAQLWQLARSTPTRA